METNKSTFYQIYPLGFCGAPEHNDGCVVPRIRKLTEWIPWLEKCGFDTVLLNPIFESDTHGYDTRDFGKIDQRLGTNQDFAEVCNSLHEKGIRVVLDGVFNHVGRGFWAFRDVLRNRENSPYKDWFFVSFDRDDNYHDGLYYKGWEEHYELVRLNLRNSEVIAHIFWNIRVWIDTFGIDGLRLDVAYCLDQDFLRQLRTFVDSIAPDFYLVGEILFGDYRQIMNPQMLHSCTNYECYKGIYSSINERNLFEIDYSLNRQFGRSSGMYQAYSPLCFLDNHDVSRIASTIRDERDLPAAYGLLFGMPGTPCIYYGSEWGVKGDKTCGGDAALRPCPAEAEENELSAFICRLIHLRKEHPAIQSGAYTTQYLTNKQLIFERNCSQERILIAVNLADDPCFIQTKCAGRHAVELISGNRCTTGSGISLAPHSVGFYGIVD